MTSHYRRHLTLSPKRTMARWMFRRVEGKCNLTTHNGSVKIDGDTGPVEIETHNGAIEAATSTDSVRLVTHNGKIIARLSNTKAIKGLVETHNGSVTVDLEESASVRLQAGTHNGGIDCSLKLGNLSTTKRSLSGTLNDGGDMLTLSTHNGSITIKIENRHGV